MVWGNFFLTEIFFQHKIIVRSLETQRTMLSVAVSGAGGRRDGGVVGVRGGLVSIVPCTWQVPFTLASQNVPDAHTGPNISSMTLSTLDCFFTYVFNHTLQPVFAKWQLNTYIRNTCNSSRTSI